ncbi:MAG TPA: hypothetical protein VFW15_14515 [Thermoanaerobaculia bacterium]|nr:hypothetical protein [Thermoanaerobaculia bacterium]
MPAQQSRLRNAAIALLVLALVLSFIALVGPNVLLRSGYIAGRLNKDPESGWLEYDSAGSRWPGTVHVKNLRFRDRDPEAEWGFQLDEADITYSLGGLLRRKFHVTRLSGRGFVFHARSRLAPKEATPVRLRRIPPIPGFPDPPLSGPSKPQRPPTGKEWTILVDGVAVESVREVWIDEYRFVGDARVTGGFFLRPRHRAEVHPAKLAARNGTLWSGRDAIARDVRATIETRIGAWDPRAFPGSRMLRFVSGDAEATGRLDDAEILNRLIGEPPGTRFERGSGRMNVNATVEGGVARGTIDYASPDLALRVLDVAMRGRFGGLLRLSGVRLRDWGGGRLNGGRVSLTDARVSDGDGKTRPWWGRIDFETGDFRPKARALFTTTASAHARDAQPLLEIANVDPPGWVERLLRLDEPVAARAAVRVGRSLVELRRMVARTGKVRISGDYVASGRSKSGTFLVDTGLLSVGIGIGGDGRDVRVFGPRKWFRERTGWEPSD